MVLFLVFSEWSLTSPSSVGAASKRCVRLLDNKQKSQADISRKLHRVQQFGLHWRTSCITHLLFKHWQMIVLSYSKWAFETLYRSFIFLNITNDRLLILQRSKNSTAKLLLENDQRSFLQTKSPKRSSRLQKSRPTCVMRTISKMFDLELDIEFNLLLCVW